MISYEMMLKYRLSYPKDECALLENGEYIYISNGDKTVLIRSDEETDETFEDRLVRSKEQGVNLFYEEWSSDKELIRSAFLP